MGCYRIRERILVIIRGSTVSLLSKLVIANAMWYIRGIFGIMIMDRVASWIMLGSASQAERVTRGPAKGHVQRL